MDGMSIVMIVGGSLLMISGIVAIIYMIIQKKRKKKQPQDETEKAEVQKSVLDVLPFAKFDLDNECYLLKDGSYLDLIKVNSKDLINSSDSEVEFDCLKFAKFFKLYPDDIKMISMNFPCNTKKQQEYIDHKIERTSNQKQIEWLTKKKNELIWLEKKKSSREFYLMIFGTNLEELHKNHDTVINTLATGREGLVENLTADKKHQILYKMNNKSSLISIR